MSDLDRVLGRRLQETTTTGDVAPVMTGGGMNGRPKRPGLVKKKDDDDSDKQRRRAVAGVLGTLGESEEADYVKSKEDVDGVIPKNAEELEDGRHDPSGLNIKKPEFKKRDPDSPYSEREQLLSPKAALVAPDVTPDSMTEIDPSDVPGPESTTFRAADAAAPPQEPAPVPPDIGEPASAPGIGGTDHFTNTMDTLLGRTRSPQPVPTPGGRPVPPPTMESAPAISPEAAAALFASGGVDVLKQDQPMPEPKVGDGKKVFESFRRYVG